MHTSLRVTGVLSGVESSVVLGLGFRRWDAAQTLAEIDFTALATMPVLV